MAIRNIVLVHGNFVDGSGWQGVYDHLTADGYRVAVVQTPNLSLAGDVAATHQVLAGLGGPAVLVGHSYGGVVITEAGNHPDVAALVYIAAFVPDKGESVSSQRRPPPATSRRAPGSRSRGQGLHPSRLRVRLSGALVLVRPRGHRRRHVEARLARRLRPDAAGLRLPVGIFCYCRWPFKWQSKRLCAPLLLARDAVRRAPAFGSDHGSPVKELSGARCKAAMIVSAAAAGAWTGPMRSAQLNQYHQSPAVLPGVAIMSPHAV
jgi:pimeloyl-ACP methyl ester carboxylesterase